MTTSHEKKLKRAVRLLGPNHCAAKNSTLEYQQQGSRVLEAFKQRMEQDRLNRKPKVVKMIKENQ